MLPLEVNSNRVGPGSQCWFRLEGENWVQGIFQQWVFGPVVNIANMHNCIYALLVYDGEPMIRPMNDITWSTNKPLPKPSYSEW